MRGVYLIERLTVCLFGRGVRILRHGVVARLLKVTRCLLRHTPAGIVVGQRFQFGTRICCHGLRHAPVQRRAAPRPQVCLYHLTHQVVREPIGARSVLNQQPRPTGCLQRVQHLLLWPVSHGHQQAQRRVAPYNRRHAQQRAG